ncbi:hypothetical protein [Neobacillus drentensis]|uniref:hypothetical protein n=1 Tax=Neobacillus drentensis TaxID=220684 RepID=UPI002FFECEE7
MTNQTPVQMIGEAKLSLMAFTEKTEQFKRLLHKDTIIDAKINFLTCEGETITVDVLEFMQLKWEEIEND